METIQVTPIYRESNTKKAVRKITEKIKQKVNLAIWQVVFLHTKKCEYWLEILEKQQRNPFREKYDDEKILMIASFIPKDVEKTIYGVTQWHKEKTKEILESEISSRQVVRILAEIKNEYPTYWKHIKYVENEEVDA